MADDKLKVILDLDNAEFVKKLRESIGMMGELGETESLEGITSTLKEIGVVAGISAAAVLAVKVALDLEKEAEHVHQVENSFAALAKSAGLAGEEIKEKLVASAKGLADDTDILQAANRAIVEMGENASRIPETMELARKASVLFGGDLIQNFEGLNRALSTGSERMLRQYGIVVDSKKAQEDYAKSIGVGVEFLTESAKKQAVMNAALEEAKKKYKDVDESTLQTTNSLKSLSVSYNELKEAIALVFDKLLGPTVKKVTEGVAYAASYWVKAIKSALGVDTQKAHEAHQENLKKETEMIGLESKAAQDSSNAKLVDQTKLHEARLKFEKEIEAIKSKRAETDLQYATTTEQAEAAYHQKSIEATRMAELEKERLKKEGLDKGIISQQQYADAVANIDATLADKQKFMEQDLEQARLKALENAAKAAKNTQQGIGAGWAVESKKAQMQLKNFSALGTVAFTSIKKNAVSAFEAMGNGSKTAGEAMKGFILGSIADMAQAQGEFLLASGIGTFDPVQIAEGGALIALASLLRSKANGASSLGGGGGGSAGGGGAGSSVSAADAGTTDKPEAEQQHKKIVNFNISGNILQTDQTKTHFMEMMREATDATDFSYKQIGQP